MDSRRRAVWMMIFYPFSMATIAAGFIGFILLFMEIPMPAVAAVVLDFYAACVVSLYWIFKPVIAELGVRKPLLGLVLTMGAFAVALTALVVWEWLGGRL